MNQHRFSLKTIGFWLTGLTFLTGIETNVHAQSTPQFSFQGTGLIANSIPFATAATGNNMRQWIYYPSNFAGAPAGFITKIYLKASAVVSPSFSGFLIRMGNTTLSTFPSTSFITNLDTVLYAASISLSSTTSNWIPIQLQTPFYYDGVSNFVVEASHQGFTTGFSVMQTTLTARSLFGHYGNPTGSSQDRLADFGIDLMPGSNDVGLTAFLSPADTMCSGLSDIGVILMNFGPNPLGSVKVGWKVNNVAQTTFNWNGSLALNDTLHLSIGTFTFNTGTSYSIAAYAFNPNGGNDTIHGNDTVSIAAIHIKTSPSIALGSVSSNFCPGDSVLLSGTLSGVPPWSFTVLGGSNPVAFSNVTTPNFSLYIYPNSSGTYTIEQLADNSGCTSTSTTPFIVTVKPAPLATISPFAGTTACAGDSVLIIANTGMNLAYQWFRNGVLLPGDTNYIYFAKVSGAYTLRTEGSNGCRTLSAPTNITLFPQPTVYLGKDTVLLPAANIQLNAGGGFASYLWSTGATTQQITVDTSGHGNGVRYIWVRATDINGCIATDTIRIHFTPNPGFEEISGRFGLHVYPNPGAGPFYIQWDGNLMGQLELRVFDALGVPIEQKILDPQETLVWDAYSKGYPLPTGVYFIEIRDSQGHKFQSRVLIMR